MGTNNAKIWGQNSTNIMSNAAAFDSDSERKNGFSANTIILSQKVNTILRQNSLMVYALSKYFASKINTFDFDFTKNGDTLSTSITNFFNNYFEAPSTASVGHSTEYVPEEGDAILFENIINDDGKALLAVDAENVVIDKTEVDEHTVNFNIGTGSYSKQIKLKPMTNSSGEIVEGLYSFLYYTSGTENAPRYTDMIYIKVMGSTINSLSGKFFYSYGATIQAYGSETIDASTLRLVLAG